MEVGRATRPGAAGKGTPAANLIPPDIVFSIDSDGTSRKRGKSMATNQKSSRKRRRWILYSGAGVGVLVVILALTGALRSDYTIDPSKLAEVERGDIARSVVATGKIEPLAKVEVKSKASGIVKEIFVHYGDRVKLGQVLVEHNQTPLIEVSPV